MDIGERIRLRMRELDPGRTQASVAAAVGMTPDALSRAINGSRGFSAAELASLSALLETSMYWLATGEQDPSEAIVLARHVIDHETGERSAEWDSLHSVAGRVALAYRQAELGRPSLPVPADAAAAREALGDGFVRTFAERITEVFDVDVIRLGGVQNACATRVLGRDIIILNETGNWFHQNWSLAHELGHVALGHLDPRGADRVPRTRAPSEENERAANSYAADLLLPRAAVLSVDWANATGDDVASFLWESGVSSDALNRRLERLRCPLSPDARRVLEWRTQRLLRSCSRWNPGGTDLITERMDAAASRRFPRALVSAHVDLVSRGLLPASTLAWILGVDEEEIEIDVPERPSSDIDELARALGLPAR